MVRIKRRYFIFQFHFDSNHLLKTIKTSQIYQTFESMLIRLYGDFGISRFLKHFSIISYNSSTNLSIIRCLKEDKHLLQTVSTFINKIIDESISCSIQTLHVSASIRQAKKYLINYSIEQLLEIHRSTINEHQNDQRSLFKQKKKKKKSSRQFIGSTNFQSNEKEEFFKKLLSDCQSQRNSNKILD